MEETKQNGTETEARTVETIKHVCETATKPEQIWEALESKGIEATPGVICQALADHTKPEKPSAEEMARRLQETESTGLTAEDLEVALAIAEKAGGIEQLVRILTVIQRTPR